MEKDPKYLMKTSPNYLINASSDEFWRAWYGLTRATDLHVKEIMNGGGIVKGGGSKSGKKHKKPKKKVPEYLKNWGTQKVI